METAATLSNDIGKKAACEALDVPRSTFYRNMTTAETQQKKERPAPPLALCRAEQQQVLDNLHEERFWGQQPVSGVCHPS